MNGKSNRGIEVNISKERFQSASQEDRDWMLFQAIQHLDGHGCRWAKGRYKRLFAIGTGAAFAGGFTAMLTKLMFWK